MTTEKPIVILSGHDASANVVFHALSHEFPIAGVICENPPSKKSLIQRRIRKLGVGQVFGQLLFQTVIAPILRMRSGARIREIEQANESDPSPVPEARLRSVSSVNSPECRALLQEFRPAIVVVNGTRIISQQTLDCVNAVFLNTHAGVTPRYRGVHGGYWALAQGDPENCGVTVHLVDKGIDTGGILYQARIKWTEKDNFTTYPALQMAAGIPLLRQAIRDALRGELKVVQGPPGSCLWSHPTAWTYLRNRIVKKVK